MVLLRKFILVKQYAYQNDSSHHAGQLIIKHLCKHGIHNYNLIYLVIKPYTNSINSYPKPANTQFTLKQLHECLPFIRDVSAITFICFMYEVLVDFYLSNFFFPFVNYLTIFFFFLEVFPRDSNCLFIIPKLLNASGKKENSTTILHSPSLFLLVKF